jgi:hypothetical protein
MQRRQHHETDWNHSNNKFLEKEIKTYLALSLFLSKKGIEEHVRVGDNKMLINPTFYKQRIKEAKKIVTELRKSN